MFYITMDYKVISKDFYYNVQWISVSNFAFY